jgi:hypothetical protein
VDKVSAKEEFQDRIVELQLQWEEEKSNRLQEEEVG